MKPKAQAVASFGIRSWAHLQPTGRIVSSMDAGRSETEGLSSIPALLRRRLSASGRHALAAALAAGLDRECHVVFSSRLGEIGRSLAIVQDMVRGEPVSPAAFGLSVHNAIPGVASIALGNRQGYSAVAAGRDTLFAGLIEAVLIANERPGTPVMLIHGDQAGPEEAQGQFSDVTPSALALRLDASTEIRLRGPFDPDANAVEPADSATAADNLMAFVSGRSDELTIACRSCQWRLDRGV